jgi:hypothetical protein
MTEPRKKRTSPSHPRLQALGWEDLEPTQLLQKAVRKLKETTEDANKRIDASIPPKPSAA